MVVALHGWLSKYRCRERGSDHGCLTAGGGVGGVDAVVGKTLALGFEEVHIVAQPPAAAGGGARRILKWARLGVLVAGSQVVEHGYSETQKTIGECQIVSEENAQTIHAHDSGRRRVWMRPRTYRRTSPSDS